MYWIIVIIIAVILVWYITRDENDEKVYKSIRGHEDTPRIRKAERNIRARGGKKAKDYLMLADMNRFNIKDNIVADEDYAIALQLAEFEQTPDIFYINDRLNPEMPLQTAVNIRNVTVNNDAQNVHDSNVVTQISKKYDIIKRGASADDDTYNRFYSGAPENVKYILYDMHRAPGFLENINATDIDVLYKVIARGQHLWPTLYSNLGECRMGDEDEGLVCVTGRVSQILDAMTLIDAEAGKPLITTDILRKEMVDYTSNYIDKLSPERRKEYEEDEDAAIEIFEEIEKNLSNQYLKLADPVIFKKILAEIQAGF